MTTAATGQFLPVGLSPTRTAASFAAPDPSVHVDALGSSKRTPRHWSQFPSDSAALRMRSVDMFDRSRRIVMFPASDTFPCSPLPSGGSRGRHTFRGPAVPHPHRYYGIVRFLPTLRPRSLVALDRQLPLPQLSRRGDWEAFPSSW